MSQQQAMDEFLSRWVKEGPAGCGCKVIQDGKVLYEGYFGYANLETQKPIDSDSIYRQDSCTKLVVCTAAMMLFERGKFLLDDPIYEYFPEWKNTQVAQEQPDGSCILRPVSRPIQVGDCFSMGMGIGYGGRDYTHRMMQQVRKDLAAEVGDYTLLQDIRAMAKVPVCFDPATRWMYGFGHELVAGLVEVTSGMRLSEFIKKEILEPLGMQSTGYHYFCDTRGRMVTAYKRSEDGQMTPAVGMFDHRFEPDAHYEAGGAGLFSTVSDYSAFTQMLALGGTYKGTRILGRKTIDLMRTNRLSEHQLQDFYNSYLAGYGYGLGVRTMLEPGKASNTSVGEFGWTGFEGSYVSIDPSEKLSVVYMQNQFPNKEQYVHHRVRSIAYGMLG